MAKNKITITPENIEEWIFSTGVLLPRNEMELARFERLFGVLDDSLTGKEIDPDRILNDEQGLTKVVGMKASDESIFTPYKMVARNGAMIPDDIQKRMKKNQQKKLEENDGSAKEKDC